MAMMRRRPFRRRFGKPVQRQQLSWVTTMFATSLDVTAADWTSNILLDDDDWQGNVAQRRISTRVKRIILNGGISPNPANVAIQIAEFMWTWAILVLTDNDISAEPATSMFSTNANTLWQTERILQSGCIVGTAMEIPAANVTSEFISLPAVSVDIKPRGLRLEPEDNLIFASAFQNSVNGVWPFASFRMLSRVLIVNP